MTVLLTSDAVWLVTEGFASDIEHAAQPTIGEMIAQLVDNGGSIWACAACTGPGASSGIISSTASRS